MVASALYVGVFLSIGVIGSSIVESVGGVDQVTTDLNRILAVVAVVYGFVLLRQYYRLREEKREREDGVLEDGQ